MNKELALLIKQKIKDKGGVKIAIAPANNHSLAYVPLIKSEHFQGFLDNYYQDKLFHDHDVFDVKQMNNYDVDLVLITSTTYSEEIATTIQEVNPEIHLIKIKDMLIDASDEYLNAAQIIDNIMIDFKHHPIDLLNINDAEREYRYLIASRDSYIRTLVDVAKLFSQINDPKKVKILEIGPYLGVLSLALKYLDYDVSVTDLPEFINAPQLQKKLNDHKIPFHASNLKTYHLPFDNNSYDLVIMCETLEHLNFNPLPVIKEINRILKINGYFYLSVPNIARFDNRMKLLRGRSLHNPMDDYFEQLQLNKNMIVGLHWKEYDAHEIEEMLMRLGFVISENKYWPYASQLRITRLLKNGWMTLLNKILNVEWIQNFILKSMWYHHRQTSLKPTIISIAKKTKNTDVSFNFKNIL